VLLQQCRKVLAGQVLVAFAAMAIVPIASRLLLPASLQLRTPQLLVLVLGQLSYGCYLLAANELILRRGDTRVAVLTVSAAAGSICLNAVLLPTVGLAGAALTTALTYSGLALAAVARINHDGDRTSVPVRTLASVAATAAVASCAIIAFT
jgi:O-antigen/teichoic acid export membrane protein